LTAFPTLKTVNLTSMRAGLPQINLPLGRTPDGIPVGLSLIGPRGADRQLLALASRLARSIERPR